MLDEEGLAPSSFFGKVADKLDLAVEMLGALLDSPSSCSCSASVLSGGVAPCSPVEAASSG